MTTPKSEAPRPHYADRAFRSPMGVLGGVLLLGLGGWMAGDAMVQGTGRAPWLALAAVIALAPLVIAFTLRPVVYASDVRMLVRNPFRTITIPWAQITELRSGFSNEVLVDGVKYQLWSVPVSLRARKKATRRTARQLQGADADQAPARPSSDQDMEHLRELAQRNATNEGAKGEITVRWAYEIIAPAVAGAIVFAVLLATG
ncbi:PH domain-containing protein [Streptomyces sp. RB6PN25]|uniref:PH domain-containing protein n=1 Tax=Streptomyces humicola TaxID=2953240 RepID=A0ABT1PXV0_9ACTN|nr:PH domain-containing protein [Streptomyces humicola]MCQ4082496.1 PH domain-containing protein [Streptomyces humicola]